MNGVGGYLSSWVRVGILVAVLSLTIFFLVRPGGEPGVGLHAAQQLQRVLISSVHQAQLSRDLTAISVHSDRFHEGHRHEPEAGEEEMLREDAEKLQRQIEQARREERYAECFTDLGAVLGDRAVNNTVVWTLANKGFSDFLLNLIVSWRLIAQPNYFVIALDPQAKEWLEELRVPCYILPENLADPSGDASNFQSFLSGTYLKFMRAKPVYTINILRLGYDQYYADADMVWLRDPMEFVRSSPDTPNVDYWVQDDTYMPCGGFYWLRASKVTEQFFQDLLAELDARPSQNEQYGQWDVMNRWAQQGKVLRWKYLTKPLFPNGRVFFQWHETQRSNQVPYIVHTNWIVGRMPKIWRMRESGLWFLDDDDYFGSNGAQFLSVAQDPGWSLDDYRETLRNGMGLAATLGRRFVVPLLPCRIGAPGAQHQWCDLTNFQVPESNPKQFDLDSQWPPLLESVGLVESALLSNPRFVANVGDKPLVLHLAVPGEETPPKVDGAVAEVVSALRAGATECGVRARVVPELFQKYAQVPHIQLTSVLHRFVGGGGSVAEAKIAEVLPLPPGRCKWQ